MTPADDVPGPGRMEPEDLDGHTLEELTDYLEAGRTPRDPSIEGSPECLRVLESLERLQGLTPDLIAVDTAAEPEADESWVRRTLRGLALEAHAGRRIPLAVVEPEDVLPGAADAGEPVPPADVGITEGAVRGLVRGAENAFPGLLVGRCTFDGDVTELGAPLRIHVEASVPYGEPIRSLVERLRAEIVGRLALHTGLNVTAVDITVRDVRRFYS